MNDIRKICRESKSGSQCYEYGVSILSFQLIQLLICLKSNPTASQGYKDSIRHFLESSSEVAQMAVQPGSTKDLSDIV